MINKKKRIVIKVGSSTLTYETGLINIRRVESLVKIISDIMNSGIEVVLVSSGAVSVGCGKLGLRQKPSDIATKQAVAAVGQCELMHIYDMMFSNYGHKVAQILLTSSVLDDGWRQKNASNTFEKLLDLGVIPIVNANDSVSIEELELEFGDNDTLSAMVSKIINADTLILLSDIEGLYTADPRVDKNAELISEVEVINHETFALAGDSGTNRGTGGMKTKLLAAELVTSSGIDMYILSGENPNILYELILDQKKVGTHFLSAKK